MDKNSIVAAMKSVVGSDHVIEKKEELFCYTYNAGGDPPSEHLPAVVVFPANATEVSPILKYANENRIPVVTRGPATNLSSGAIPVSPDCIILSTKRMLGVDIDEETLTATVGAGEIIADVKKGAAIKGLFYPPDPASYEYASIGGSVAENAGGLQCVKYGTTKDYVMGLEVVLPSGEIIHTGGKCVKNVVGYNVTQLYVGSEGTLGVITKVILKLIALPASKQAMLAIFDDVENASKAVSQIMISGAVPSIMEFMENTFIRGVEEYAHAGLPVDAAAILLIEVDGDESSLDKQILKIREVCERMGVREFKIAKNEQEADQFWKARRAALPALARVAKGRFGGDPSVPINRLSDVIRKLKELEKKYDIKNCCSGHAGDGNIHPNFFFNTPEEKIRAGNARTELHEEIIKMGGTVTGEHGIGRTKLKYMKMQLGEAQYEAMRAIKKALDPNNILNPGCTFGE